MPKENYDDPKKSIVRERWKSFTSTNLSGNPRDWVVVCFPWGDWDRSYEIEEVYDPLRVQRRNIFAIERIRERARRLKYLYPDVEVFEGEDRDFFEQFNGKFHIGHLDYDGTLNDDAARSLEVIAGRQLLTNPSVLATTFSGRREGADTRYHYYSTLVGGEYAKDVFNFVKSDAIRFSSVVRDIRLDNKDEVEEFLRSVGYSDDPIKDIGITEEVNGILDSGMVALDFNPLSKKLPHFDRTRDQIEKAAQKLGVRLSTRNALISHCTLLEITDFLEEMGIRNPEICYLLASLAFCSSNRPYISQVYERYKYGSSGGTTMFSDFFALRQFPDITRRYSYLIENMFGHVNILEFYKNTWGILPIDKRRKDRIATIVLDDKRKMTGADTPPRIELGSSASIPVLTGLEYYQERVKVAEEDVPVEALHERLLQEWRVTRRQLQAYEEHTMMGIHGPPPSEVVKEPIVQQLATDSKKPVEAASSQPAKEPYSLRDLLPREYRHSSRHFPENQTLRMEYFIAELYGMLKPEEMEMVLANVKASKWYENNKGKPTDTQIYAFFDDLTLMARNSTLPSPVTIKKIYQAVLNDSMSPAVGKYVTK